MPDKNQPTPSAMEAYRTQLRDYFATYALGAILGNNTLLDSINDVNPHGQMHRLVARDAYAIADAMLAERSK